MALNPYKALGLADFAPDADIQQAYNQINAQFMSLSNPSEKQVVAFEQACWAHDQLSNPMQRSEIDQGLRAARFIDVPHITPEPDSVAAPHDELFPPEIQETDRRMTKANIRRSSGAKKLFWVSCGMLALFMGFILTQGMRSKTTTKTPQRDDKPPVVVTAAVNPKATSSPPPALLERDLSKVGNMVFYTDPGQLQASQVILDPTGLPFPQDASVLSSLPWTGSGDKAVSITNTKSSAIYGRLVWADKENFSIAAARYFYIPPKQSLMLFQLPSGRIQVHIMTLTNPIAYISPVYQILDSDTRAQQLYTDWSLSVPAHQLF